ncbi:MAG: hypothetical protein JNL61_05055 [Rhizobiaceae bacterium]|nr:hypothetical protein [Rhizobiaceae bacterium]
MGNDPGRAPRALAIAGLCSAALGLAACQSAPPPAQMSKTTTVTAPADLQLLCANAVAQSTGAASANVLPVSSAQIDADNYEVILAVGQARHKCVVNNDGIVRGVTPA